MDIETLRRANEALSLMEETQKLLDHERKEIDKGTRRIEILEARIAGCKQTLMECGVAVPVSRIIRCEPLRTLESEGQKWDEEARAQKGSAAERDRAMAECRQAVQMELARKGLRNPYTPEDLSGLPQNREHHGC